MSDVSPAFPMSYEKFSAGTSKEDFTEAEMASFQEALAKNYRIGEPFREGNASGVESVLFREAWNFSDSLPAIEWEYERLVNIFREAMPFVESRLMSNSFSVS